MRKSAESSEVGEIPRVGLRDARRRGARHRDRVSSPIDAGPHALEDICERNVTLQARRAETFDGDPPTGDRCGTKEIGRCARIGLDRELARPVRAGLHESS